MGQGIAQVTASHGHTTRIYDAAPGRAATAREAIAAQLEKLVAKGKVTSEARQKTLDAIAAATDVSAACSGADVVIEAVPENMELKVALFRDVVASAPKHALLASNTSSLSLTEMAASCLNPQRVIGLHFFNPAPVMELLEVVQAEQTSAETCQRALELARRLGKTPILVRDVAGFASSRLGIVLGMEAIRMVESGVASVADIDRAMELGYRHPMGPLRLTDLVGLDVRLAIAEHLTREIGAQFSPPPLLRRLVRAGRLGKKTGQGFYRWDAQGAVLE